MENATAYMPMDRRWALAQGRTLPDRADGAVLFADISGFTPLTEALAQAFGARRGADELTRQLNTVYDALIAEVHRYAGSVIGFSGDAITCWFDAADPPGRQAVLHATAAAVAMQETMAQFATLVIPNGSTVVLAIKTVVAAGPVRRFLVGDPSVQLIDVLAGTTLDRMAEAEDLAQKGELLLDSAAYDAIQSQLLVDAWRPAATSGNRYAVVAGLRQPVDPVVGHVAEPTLDEEAVRAWLLPAVYERLRSQQGRYMAELRPAASLFVRFGGLDYDHDDEAGTKLDAYVRWVQRILTRYEGALIQLTTGDKGSYLYAAFGAPVAHDDDASRAVAAALDLRQLPARLDFISQVQMGISQGRMRVGAYGSQNRRTYGVLGDEVNLAARLMGQARPGQILVSPRVAEAVAGRCRLQPLGSVKLKGKQEPLSVFAVEGRKQSFQEQFASIFATPLVGREAELARMEQALQTVLAGTGQILRVEGEAGVGKSHLVANFIRRATQRDVQVAIGACQSISQDVAYFSGRQVARQLLGLAQERASDPAESIDQLRTIIGGMDPDWLLRLPLLGDLLGLPIPDSAVTAAFDPRLRQEALLALAVEIVQTRARSQPLLLLVEDVHWIDEATQRLLLALARVIADAPILLLLVHRPATGADDRLLAELSELPHQTHLRLAELSDAGVAALVANRLAEDGSAQPAKPVSGLALSLIQAQAQGNPFFSEELVDALRETGYLVQEAGQWTLSPAMVAELHSADCLQRMDGEWVLAPDAPLSSISLGIPDSIHGIVLSRLDRLPETVKLTLKVASVIGRIFEFDLLAQVHPAGDDSSALLAQIDVLNRRDFARLERPHPQLSYIFKHNITQEVVYKTLLEGQQHELHFSVARCLEQWQPEAVERLAFHFRHSDLNAAGVRDKTLHYLEAAAERSRREYANETALSYYERALALDWRWQWLVAKVAVLHILGRREAERATLQELAAHPEAPAFQVQFRWGQYYEAISDYAAAQAAMERALAASRGAGDRHGKIRCLASLGEIARRQGDYDVEEQRYGQALTLLGDEPQFRDVQAEVLYGLGIVYRQQGKYEAAKEALQETLALNRALDKREEEARTLTALGSLAFLQRNFSETLGYYQQALAIRRRIGDRAGEGAGLMSLAQAVVRGTGDYSRAEGLLREALAIQQAINDRWRESIIWNELGIIYLLLGALAPAEESLRRGLALSRAIGDDAGEAYVLVNLGQVLREQGQLAAAEQLLTQGLAIAKAQGDRYLEAQYYSDLALTHQKANRLGAAVKQASAALAILRDMGLSLSTTTDLTTLATAHLAAKHHGAALAYTGQALAILDECGGEGPDFPHRDYFHCYRVLWATGRTERAERALSAAHRLLMAQAEKISDAAMRRSYLENVAYNRAIVRTVEARRGG